MGGRERIEKRKLLIAHFETCAGGNDANAPIKLGRGSREGQAGE